VQGKRLGAYTLISELGSGGMGTVYRATGPEGQVALKVVHPHLVGREQFRERFQREVEIGGRIRHDNVVATLDAGEIETEGRTTLYLAMELVEGQTLRALLDELGTVPEELCRHIGREVARALGAIHETGVLHRDLKPENVLITPDHRVKVMDLGVALLAEESLRLSRTGVFVGSVLYAAPEQFADRQADARADLYTLGLLLYELATAQHPFRSDDVVRVIQGQRETPARPPAELNPQLSPFFEEIVTTLLAKQPEQRFASAAQLLEALEGEENSAWWQERAQALRSETERPLRRVRIPRETSLHGRDEELERLLSLYERARQGDGQMILLGGEAGIGKTRLIDEFVERLHKRGEDFNFLVGSYPPGGAATAAGALSTAYREFFGGEGLAARLHHYLEQTPGLVPAFAALLLGEPPPTGVAPLSKDSLQSVFVLTTQALAAERPTIVVIEDLQFAPETGLAIFSALAASIPHHRVLLLGTSRPGLPEQWVAGVAHLEHAAQLKLRRLTPKELQRLLVDLFRSERLAGELGWQIATKSDGNPFFVFELVRSLREGQLIALGTDGTWIQTRVIEDISVPSSVLDLVEARITDLDREDKDLLEVASCCGFEFDPLLVMDALQMEQIPAMKRLAFLEKKHRLVRAAGRRYVFDHHQVQEALYRGLPELLREPYHAALGAALERRQRDPKKVDGAVAVELCEHYLRGVRGPDAVRYLPGALKHMTDGYLHNSAIALADRALSVPGALEGEQRVEILLRKSSSLEMRARHDETRATLEEALALADALGDPALRSRILCALGRLGIWISKYDEARERLNQALEAARQADDRSLVLAATGNLAIISYRARRFEEAGPLFQRCLEIAREIGDRRAEAVGTVNMGNVFWCLGKFDDARARYERYRDISREIGYREGEALAAGNLGNVVWSLGRPAEARKYYSEVLEIAAATGDRHKTALFTTSLGALDLMLSRLESAEESLGQSLALAREAGMRREEASALFGLASAAEKEGNVEEARRLYESSLALYREIGEREGAAGVLIVLGRLDVEAEREEQAARYLNEAVASLQQGGDLGQRLICHAVRARLPGNDAEVAEKMLAEQSDRRSVLDRLHAGNQLWLATGNRDHLEEAHRMLMVLRDNAPEEDRDSMIENVPLHRDIMRAWEALEPKE
jgi:tetratricopeptide (TPR) repeat protein